MTISDGLRPIGNMYKAVSVRTPGVAKSSTWLTAKRDGSSEVLDGHTMVHDIDDEVCEIFEWLTALYMSRIKICCILVSVEMGLYD